MKPASEIVIKIEKKLIIMQSTISHLKLTLDLEKFTNVHYY